MKHTIPILLLALSPSALSARPVHGEDGWSVSRPDGHAPIGVMGEHMHSAGEWMVSLRTMRMHMEGNLLGPRSISAAEVFANTPFTILPTEMDMTMHMVGAMYAPTDDLTLMAMIPLLDNSMDHVTAGGGAFTTETDGLGDVRLTGLIALYDEGDHRVHANAGLSLPTGSTDETVTTPMGTPRGPYPMQLGSGTFDLAPGLTWLGQNGDWSYGAQGTLLLRTGDNDEGYRLGNRKALTAWFARRLSDRWSVSLRLGADEWNDIHGADPVIGGPVPTADPDLRAGSRVDLGLGVNWLSARGHRVGVEASVPLAQDLDGPQLETDWVVTVGYQFAWGGHHD